MKRRPFLKNSTALGASLFIGNIGTARPDHAEQLLPSGPVQELQKLENEFMRFVMYSDASATVLDKTCGKSWNMGPVAIQDKSEIEEGHVWLRNGRGQHEQYPGRFVGEKTGDGLMFTLVAPQNRIAGRFKCGVTLDGKWLVYRIYDITDSVPSLVFPPPIQSDAIILPMGVGRIIRNKESGSIYTRHLYPFYTRLNMRWIGGQKEDAAWIGIFDRGFEDSCALVANRTAAPAWMRTLSSWKHDYTFRIAFMKGDYVDLAKTYRNWFRQHYPFDNLEEKIKRNPALDSFRGGRAFWFMLATPAVQQKTAEDFFLEIPSGQVPGKVQVHMTYADLKAKIEHLQRIGLRKGFIKIAGWIQGGYDYSHQDIWPPEPSLGSVDELRELLAMKQPLISGLHDNNQDIYAHTPGFPEGVNLLKNGEWMEGGTWAGGQAYILNSSASLAYARRNWQHIRTLHPPAMFVDIITAMQLYQTYEPGKHQSKADDLRHKTELMRFYKEQGILLGSEEAADFGIPYLDWFENRHQRVQGESIPLWPLVFHDAAFCTRYGGVIRNTGYPGWLEDMLWGYLPHFFIRSDRIDESLFTSLDHVDAWHEKIGTAEMVSHRFLTEDLTVERTEFSGGEAIVCNFGKQDYEEKGTLIGPGDYKLLT